MKWLESRLLQLSTEAITWLSCESDYRAVNATLRDGFIKSQATSLNDWKLNRPSLKSSSVYEFAPLAWEAVKEPADPPCSEIMLHHVELFSEVFEHNWAQLNDPKAAFTADHCGSLNERKQLENTLFLLLLLPPLLLLLLSSSSSSSSVLVVQSGCNALAQLAGGAGECLIFNVLWNISELFAKWKVKAALQKILRRSERSWGSWLWKVS